MTDFAALFAQRESWTDRQALAALLLSSQAYNDEQTSDPELQELDHAARAKLGSAVTDELAQWAVTTHASADDMANYAAHDAAVDEMLTQLRLRTWHGQAALAQLARLAPMP